MKVVILAGGKGSRMGELVSDLPKPMVQLAGKPIMEHQIDLAKRYGLKEFRVLTGYKAEVLESYFGHGDAWGVNITYHREDHPLGTAGAVKELEGELDELLDEVTRVMTARAKEDAAKADGEGA